MSRWRRHDPSPADQPDPNGPGSTGSDPNLTDPDRTEWIPTPGRSWQPNQPTAPTDADDRGPGPRGETPQRDAGANAEEPTEWIAAADDAWHTGEPTRHLPGPEVADHPAAEVPGQPPDWFTDLTESTDAVSQVADGTDGADGFGHVPVPQPVVDAEARARQQAGAREEVLGRVRAAIGGRPAPEDDVPRGYRRTLGISRDEVVELFADRVADYKATVRRIPREQLAATIAVCLVEHGIRRIAVPLDLPTSWLPQYVDVKVDHGQLTGTDLDAVDGVITGCALGIAETGTIVLDGGRLQGRRLLSLVPDYHLCVVDTLDVVGNLPEALGRLDPTRPITFISGPSATSDIELDRVEGVHGPRTLDVVLTG